jgi:hypothetical protein
MTRTGVSTRAFDAADDQCVRGHRPSDKPMASLVTIVLTAYNRAHLCAPPLRFC